MNDPENDPNPHQPDEQVGTAPGRSDETVGDAPAPGGNRPTNMPLVIGGVVALLAVLAVIFGVFVK